GYIALGFFVARQMIWVGVIVLTLYLLIHLLQDLFHTLLSPDSPRGKHLQTAFDLTPNTLNQATVVLSGVSRLALMLFAVIAVLAPFNAGPRELMSSASRLFGGVQLGSLPIDPTSIADGLLVLVIGWLALHTLKRWLTEQLLPNTSMAPGMRDSVITLVGYVGGLLVFVLTLASLHVDLKSITWIVSALSVGIGFGLQAIVSNFISGLILLAERPVKAGDWISIDNGAVEGDVLRINVRATEILQWDRSTVIVPNSQLITQNVRNVTTTRALGRVHFSLPMPLDTDAGRAREIMLTALREHPSILADPEPFVRLESITANCMTFNAYAYTGNPRDIFGIKSDLQFSVLEQLRAQKLRLIRPQDMRMYNVPPAEPPAEDEPRGG
ncbi:MAG: mechanosensitive ion channel, partial [Pseudomonadota bacterium]|nr:mechanosensitive ion channel [Pseudomonadota bacterium]